MAERRQDLIDAEVFDRIVSWTFEEVDKKLKSIMVNIYKNSYKASVDYGCPGNLVVGANIAGFLKVAEAMKWQGIAC